VDIIYVALRNCVTNSFPESIKLLSTSRSI